ncbi:deaminase [Couchioplanes caeruleus]|uniref:dCMP deaminase n=2 Tax=Couchioplanes caeruleus TaxID=56438 RepID=A0A1K0GJB5_9ACTN|nr:deaminase [Couchioplanes caeruleus]OJF12366.1 dCMP deaminase [Couchioplanes caeruleus subsp. caeruleus]ROP33328.1 diaminohydroxyphosphoribosylaminopyrimidine deaminase [Couchioplanes caeruleus]
MASSEDRRWLTAAIDLSRLSLPTPTNYAVGAIVVDHHGHALATGYTGEWNPRDHAEEVALAKLAAVPRPDLAKATIYSTLEPCTARRSRPGTCTGLILARGIGRVVFALREPLILADCRGAESLREAGVDVDEIDDLGPLVREINAQHFIAAQ